MHGGDAFWCLCVCGIDWRCSFVNEGGSVCSPMNARKSRPGEGLLKSMSSLC